MIFTCNQPQKHMFCRVMPFTTFYRTS